MMEQSIHSCCSYAMASATPFLDPPFSIPTTVYFDKYLVVFCHHSQEVETQVEPLADDAESIGTIEEEFPTTERLVDGLDDQPLE
jgi:hypothetical protein